MEKTSKYTVHEIRQAQLSAVLKKLLEVKREHGKANAALVLEMALLEGDNIAKDHYDLLSYAIENK